MVSLLFPIYQYFVSPKHIFLANNSIAVGQVISSMSFFFLIYCFLLTDLSVINVIGNSNSEQPLVYKIASAWSNHEGSMTLWLWIFMLVAFLYNNTLRNMPRTKGHTKIKIVIYFILFFCIFLLLTSSPYLHLYLDIKNGSELSPILQDMLLMIHPPIMYSGYLFSAMPFFMSILLMMLVHKYKRISILNQFVQNIKFWNLVSFLFLTLGIGLGSWWAYFELGWGGWWFWDPVENVSLLPWLCALMLMHYLVSSKKDYRILVTLSILPFYLSLVGTFMVRSGFLDSVHSFAEDSNRGTYLTFGILVISVLYVKHIYTFSPNVLYEKLKRSVSIGTLDLSVGNILFTFFILNIVIIGTFYPSLYKYLFGQGITIGYNFFHNLINPLMLPVVYSITISLIGKSLLKTAEISKLTTGLLVVTLVSCYSDSEPLSFILINSLVFSVVMIIWVSLKNKFKNIVSASVSHISFLLFVLFSGLSSYYKREITLIPHIGDMIQFENINVAITNISQGKTNNYSSNILEFILKYNHAIASSYSEKRYYFFQDFYSSKPHVLSSILYDLYFILGDGDYRSGWEYKIHLNPAMSLIWMVILVLVGSIIVKIVQTKKRFHNTNN